MRYQSYFCGMENHDRNSTLEKAADHIKKGEVILCPTDTIYGLSCDAGSEEAIKKINRIKGVKENRPYIVLVNSERQINQLSGELPAVAWDLIDEATTPLTLIVPASNFLPEILRPEQMVAIRYLRKGFTFDLLKKINRPMISTSANLAGGKTPIRFEEIDDEIKAAVDYIVPPKYGEKGVGRASKIIRLDRDARVEILRK